MTIPISSASASSLPRMISRVTRSAPVSVSVSAAVIPPPRARIVPERPAPRKASRRPLLPLLPAGEERAGVRWGSPERRRFAPHHGAVHRGGGGGSNVRFVNRPKGASRGHLETDRGQPPQRAEEHRAEERRRQGRLFRQRPRPRLHRRPHPGAGGRGRGGLPRAPPGRDRRPRPARCGPGGAGAAHRHPALAPRARLAPGGRDLRVRRAPRAAQPGARARRRGAGGRRRDARRSAACGAAGGGRGERAGLRAPRPPRGRAAAGARADAAGVHPPARRHGGGGGGGGAGARGRRERRRRAGVMGAQGRKGRRRVRCRSGAPQPGA